MSKKQEYSIPASYYNYFISIKSVFTISIALLTLFSACKMKSGSSPGNLVVRDTTVTPENAFLNSFLDSARVEEFLAQAELSQEDSTGISNFYKDRNYEYAWFDTDGLTEHAASFVSLFRNYRSSHNDTILKSKKLDAVIDDMMNDSNYVVHNSKLKVSTELGLTRQFFQYARKAYAANENLDPQDLGWFIPKKKINIRKFLDSVVANKNAKIKAFEPVHPMFTPLHDYLEKYSAIEKKGGWPQVPAEVKSLKEKDSSAAVGLLKKRLQATGDLPGSDTGNIFTAATKQGVINFQQRYGLKEDGIVNDDMIEKMNVPIGDRIKQLVVNIERIKWIPQPPQGRYLVANIPAFKLYAYESGQQLWDMNVVVGDQAHHTVVFSDVLETIAFSPYWNVPYSIVKDEMADQDEAYFERNNMEIVGTYGDGLPQVRQKPGPKNSLGKVKFLFPNSFAIYFHDTPAKWLFNKQDRAASHGCIRLADPKKMASWLLDYDPEWTETRIQEAMNLDEEKQVKLERTVPVFIGYFTNWVDKDGRLSFRDDIYGHDQKMIRRLFE